MPPHKIHTFKFVHLFVLWKKKPMKAKVLRDHEIHNSALEEVIQCHLITVQEASASCHLGCLPLGCSVSKSSHQSVINPS